MRRAAWLGAAAVAAVGVWAGLIEPRRTRVRERTLRLPGWPAELSGLRVAVVSDLHAGGPHVDAGRVAQVVSAVNRRRPDLALLLGDYVDDRVALGGREDPEEVAAALGGLRAGLGAFAVLGNHDLYEGRSAMTDALERAGIQVLDEEARAVEADGRRVWLVGLGEVPGRPPDPGAAFASVPPGAPALALAHHPDVFPRVPARAALTLAGHTHGGQVALPGLRARVVPSQYGDRYAAGHVVEDGRHLFVTRGVGSSRLPLRFRSPPEAVVLRLRAASGRRPGRGRRRGPRRPRAGRR